MIAGIMEGIRETLLQEFGEGYSLYVDTAEENKQKPCFLISCTNLTMKPYRGKRYWHTCRFLIRYLTDGAEKQMEYAAVSERLFDCLHLLAVEGELLRGTEMTAQLTDEGLNFTVNYDYFRYLTDAEPKMDVFGGTITEVKG